MRLSLSAGDLIILPQKRFFVKHFFEKLLNFSELKSFSSFSVLTGTFERSLVLFKGFLLRLWEVILLSQRLALKYNTTPRQSCQHFLTSFFQFLCGRGVGAKLQPQRTLSGIAARCQIPPFVTCGDIFPRPGEICPLGGAGAGAPERVQSYIITLYRQSKSQPGIDGGWYYPPESKSLCQDFPCKILSRKISTIFGDCYKTQNIVVFCLTCH